MVLTVTDGSSNQGTCGATVTVADDTNPCTACSPPTAVCQDATVSLDATGNITLVSSDIDNGSSDACGIASRTPTPNSFTCGFLGANAVILSVFDGSGNGTNCLSTVTVADTIDPSAVCQDITVQLDAGGIAPITTGDVDNGSTDACGTNMELPTGSHR